MFKKNSPEKVNVEDLLFFCENDRLRIRRGIGAQMARYDRSFGRFPPDIDQKLGADGDAAFDISEADRTQAVFAGRQGIFAGKNRIGDHGAARNVADAPVVFEDPAPRSGYAAAGNCYRSDEAGKIRCVPGFVPADSFKGQSLFFQGRFSAEVSSAGKNDSRFRGRTGQNRDLPVLRIKAELMAV